jgi:ribulose-phosphate 3-epimerase
MKISPSILDADFMRLGAELESIATCDRIHLDIMDGQYVPNLSFGAAMLKRIAFEKETEVHLMVNNPEYMFEPLVKLGVKTIIFHIENTGRARALELVGQLQKMGVRAGVCIDGYTEVAFLDDAILKAADMILLMSVKAGFGGQKFMETVVDKAQTLRTRGFEGEIEVDGGVNLDNAPRLAAAGVDIVVVGSFLMKHDVAERAMVIEKFQSLKTQ